MPIIGGHVTKTEDKPYRVQFLTSKGERSSLTFFTIRSARNWIREHAQFDVISLRDTVRNVECFAQESEST